MDYSLLQQTIDKELEKLDLYYEGKLSKEPRAHAEFEAHKDDLLQDLQYYLLTKYHTNTYKDWEPIVFIWKKAKMMWIRFIRKLYRQTQRQRPLTDDDLANHLCDENFLDEFETKDWLQNIQMYLRPDEITLLKYRAEGYTYRQIVELGDYSSESAVKTKFHRIKMNIRQQFGQY